MADSLSSSNSTPMWYCRTCGIVRSSDERPWCRHYALELPAARMVPLPSSHPVAGEPPENWTEERNHV